MAQLSLICHAFKAVAPFLTQFKFIHLVHLVGASSEIVMSDTQLQFQNRLRSLERKHYKTSTRGYTTRMRPDGLIVVKPRRAPSRISGKSVLMFVAAFLLFKGFLIANLGIVGYDERIARLNEGTPVEQAGAWVMQIEPASEWIATKIGPVLR
jgi:hypothetical protein